MKLSHTKVSDWQVLYKVRPPFLNLEIQVKPPACVPNPLYSCPHVQLYPSTLKKNFVAWKLSKKFSREWYNEPSCSFNTLTYANLVSHLSSLTFLFLDYFEAVSSHHVTSPINISIWFLKENYFFKRTIPLSYLKMNILLLSIISFRFLFIS